MILEAPTVNVDLTYYPTNGFNERLLGFHVENANNPTTGQFPSGHMVSNSGQNLFILTTPEGRDANLNRQENETDNTFICIGNAFLSDYSLDLSVGSLPTASVSFEASNISTDASVSGDLASKSFTGIESPGINPTLGTALGTSLSIPFATGNSFSGDYVADDRDKVTALRPGDIQIDLSDFSGNTLSSLVGDNGIHVQSAALSVPLSRTPIERLGSKFPFARTVDFPINATLNVSAVVNTVEAQNLADLISGCEQSLNSVTLTLLECDQTPAMKIKLLGCTLDSENFSSSIGSNKSVDLTFSTQLGGVKDKTKGVFFSGSNDTKLPWE